MKKHSYVILVILMLSVISILTYKSVFLPDTIQVSESGAPAEESAIIPEPGVSSSADAVIAQNGQALKIEAIEPAADVPQAVTEPTRNESSKTLVPTTTVSRGAQTTDTYKYPKLSKVNGSFGQFRYRDLSGGRIEVDPQWIANNIATITLPGLNQRVQVNRAAADNFIKAFTLIKNGTTIVNGRQVSLLSLIRTMDGTFVTRHVNWGGPATGLSNHSWGTAIDINASNHYVGLRIDPNSTTDPNAILWREAFQPAGFSWGNRYNVGPDSMHYELIK